MNTKSILPIALVTALSISSVLAVYAISEEQDAREELQSIPLTLVEEPPEQG